MVEATGTKDSCPTVKLWGEYTCCVPGCYSNSKQEKHLSFYMIPKDKILETKWLNAIKRKDFTPGKHHRVCSLHFKDGKKMGATDVPKLIPLIPKPTFRKPPKERSTQCLTSNTKHSSELPDSVCVETNNTESTEALVEKLQQEVTELKMKVCALTVEKFGLQCFAGSDDDIRSYTGLSSYSVFCSFYKFLGPAVNQLNYWGSDFKDDQPFGTEKCGPARNVQPIDELFLVLYQFRCNALRKILETDLICIQVLYLALLYLGLIFCISS